MNQINLDFYIFQQINQFAGEFLFLDALAVFFAKYLGYVLIFFLILFLLKNIKKYWRMVITAFGAAIFTRFFIANIIHWFYYWPRPFVRNEVNLLLQHANVSSFPSGHAVFYFALSTVVYFYNKKAGILFLIASFIISFARVFCGIHWPSDIIAGALIGVFFGWLIYTLSKKFFK